MLTARRFLTSGVMVPVKEVSGLFQALTEGGWGGLMGPTADGQSLCENCSLIG